MGLPTIRVELDLNQPTGSPSWADVTAYCRGWSVRRGRQYERDRVQAGTATITLDNRDRRFDPTHAAGPYFGSLKPLRRMRISATWAGATYPVYTGYVERWPLVYNHVADATVEIQASDGLAVLALKKLNTSYPQQNTAERVAAVLDDASWTVGSSWVLGSASNGQLGTTTVLGPVGDRALDAGLSTVQAETLSDTPALMHLQTVAQVENGLLYVAPDGAVAFRNRAATLYGNGASLATFGDGDGELPYRALTLTRDMEHVYNEVRVTRTGGALHAVEDAASQADYFIRTLDLSDLPLDHVDGASAAEAEAQSLAEYLLSRYREPGLRISQIVIQGQRNDSLWPHVLGRDLGDRVTVTRRPPGGGDAIAQLSAVESVAHNWRPGYWETAWQLSPVDTAIYWKLGDPVASVLGVTTTPAY
jgi:hypothetical protein